MADETIYDDKMVAWDGAYPDAGVADTWAVEVKTDADRRMMTLNLVDPDGNPQVIIIEVSGRDVGIRAFPGDRDEPLVVARIGQDRAVFNRNVAEQDSLEYVIVDDEGMRFAEKVEPSPSRPKVG